MRVAIGTDFNGHIRARNRYDEEAMGRFGILECPNVIVSFWLDYQVNLDSTIN